ncbi:MAG: aminopeptidase P family protein, partial [Alphaproteobacteria bacterium]
MNKAVAINAAAQRLSALRGELARRRLDGFIVPLADEHLSEYVAPYAQRLAWLTGFQGSAGTAVVLADKAAIFIDGRYTIQVRQEVDITLFAPVEVPATLPADWLASHAPAGARIGYDPWLHSQAWLDKAREHLAPCDIALVAVADNPVDALWHERPPLPEAPAVPHALEYTGRAHGDKLADMAKGLREKHADAVVLSALDSIAWTFNIRGEDVAHTPVAMAFAIVRADTTADVFIDPAKRGRGLAAHLGGQVRLHPRSAFEAALAALGAAKARVLVDPAGTVAAIVAALAQAGARIVKGRDPAVLPKACK